jgi:hypothetical protein
VYSCTIGNDRGQGLLAFLADRRSSGDLSFFLKQAGSVPKKKKMSAMARPQI